MEEILSEDFVLDQSSPSDDLKQLLRDADIKVLTVACLRLPGKFQHKSKYLQNKRIRNPRTNLMLLMLQVSLLEDQLRVAQAEIK